MLDFAALTEHVQDLPTAPHGRDILPGSRALQQNRKSLFRGSTPLVCQVLQDAAASCWTALLTAREYSRHSEAAGAWLYADPRAWHFAPTSAEVPAEAVSLYLRRDPSADHPAEADFVFCQLASQAGQEALHRFSDASLPDDAEAVLRLYLPILMGAWQARLSGGSFTSAHVAQTLDGRIACHNGHSQWISNEANLWHAHRLRALHDAVLVGSGTVRHDDPQLTVRHVEGVDPRRVVLSGSARVLDLADTAKIFAAPGCTLVSTAAAVAELSPNGVHEHTEFCSLPVPDGDSLPVDAILQALAARGLHSVFVEGGSGTCSSFFAAGAIDLFHVHIAPMFLGSGIPSMRLPEVSHVRDGHHLHMEHYGMDGELLLVCRRKERT